MIQGQQTKKVRKKLRKKTDKFNSYKNDSFFYFLKFISICESYHLNKIFLNELSLYILKLFIHVDSPEGSRHFIIFDTLPFFIMQYLSTHI